MCGVRLRVVEDLADIARKPVGKDRCAFDNAGIAEARLFARDIVTVDQGDIPAPFLQVQGGTDTDHSCPQDHSVGLEFRHPALRKLNVLRAPLPLILNPSRCPAPAQTRLTLWEIALARPANSGNMHDNISRTSATGT
jgi:hypothetical protein